MKILKILTIILKKLIIRNGKSTILGVGSQKMERKKMLLAVLSAAKGGVHTPVQVQKLFFLIDHELSHLIGGPHFNFQPYNYGPFDKDVYVELFQLANEGLIQIVSYCNWNNYILTSEGQKMGEAELQPLPPKAQEYINKASSFVRSLSFTQLVSAIYNAFPQMRKNSVFQG